MKTVECIQLFHDLGDGQISAIRKEGDTWETTSERAKELEAKGFVKIISTSKKGE